MKRKLSIVLGICLAIFSLFGISAFAEQENDVLPRDEIFLLAFDINGDGKINTADSRLVLRISLSLEQVEITEQAEKAGVTVFGDTNGDNRVTTSDARRLLRYSLRLDSSDDFILPGEMPNVSGDKYSYPDSFDSELLEKNVLLSPYDNHNLGRSAMMISKSEYSELTPSNVSNLRSYPLMSPFIKGTVDYVTRSATYYSEDVYILKSGAKIETEDATYIPSGYIMPDNVISFVGIEADLNQTDVFLKTDWLVPICVQFKPQKYYEGYDNRVYNLTEFTAEYMEIQFSHTSAGSGKMIFPEGSVFSSADWSTASATKVTTLRLNLSQKGKFFGYDISMTDTGYLKISAKNHRPELQGKTIVLDPGHGGVDGGGGSNGVYESGINLKTALYLKNMLENQGVNVVMTRSDDRTVSLAERVALTRVNNADLFLSIHCDVADSTSAAGVSVYYYYPYSMPYAKALQNGLVKAYRTSVYSSSSANYSKVDRDIKFYPFMVARVETCPAVLIELGFLSNAEERATLQKDSTQRALASGIYNGIADYFNS